MTTPSMQAMNVDSGDELSPPAELHLNFQGTMLSVRIADRQMERHLRESFRFMIVPEVSHDAFSQIATLDLVTDQPIRPELQQFIHNAVFRRFMSLRPDLIWMHAGAVEQNGSATLIAGASGQGKSTLTTMLCQAGFSYMSDDVAPIDMESDIVYPFPQTPRKRIPSLRALAADEVQSLARTVVPIENDAVRTDPAPIARIVLLDYQPGAAAHLAPLSVSEAALGIIGSLTNFVDHRESAVARSVRLANSVPAFRLTFGLRAESAVQLIEAS